MILVVTLPSTVAQIVCLILKEELRTMILASALSTIENIIPYIIIVALVAFLIIRFFFGDLLQREPRRKKTP
jgi:uncharacterized membrane protein YdjX (TVP38/TMEM64 family)